ncbi:hypothetical protein BDQ17DRAFT_1369608 [Cyathus striatus]|nr:hypothetical protein BDQ17DRAFT_1369608 [Cyathus striatus]
MFLGPRLITVDITFDADAFAQLSLVPILRERHSSLENVTFIFFDSSELEKRRGVEFISNSGYKWQNLRMLNVTDLTFSALLEVAQLPNLRSLKLSECELNMPTSGVQMNGGFPALEELQILSRGAANCTTVLKVMDLSPIIKAHLQFASIETAESWRTLFLNINKHWDHDKLSSLHCSDGVGAPLRDSVRASMSASSEIVYDDIKPLIVFSNLKVFSMLEMATSWRNIEYLAFISTNGWYTQPIISKITLMDLLPFAEHCPFLGELSFPIDATFPPEIDTHMIRTRICQTHLKKLVENSPIKKPSLVAAFLSGIFPSLQQIIYNGPHNQEAVTAANERTWGQVEELVKVFSAVRAEERLYIK